MTRCQLRTVCCLLFLGTANVTSTAAPIDTKKVTAIAVRRWSKPVAIQTIVVTSP